MEFTDTIDIYRNEITEIAYEGYCREAAAHSCLTKRTKESFADFLNKQLWKMNGIVALEDGRCTGFLLYSMQEEELLYCRIPVWGYGATGEKRTELIARLFQYLAGLLVSKRAICFSVRLYAHDEDTQKLFSLMQFGIQSEKGIRAITEIDYNPDCKVRAMDKAELELRWTEVWGLLARLIQHLQKSPVFYPAHEFTEEAYKAFFSDSGTRVYIAEDAGKIIGLIETNAETMDYLFPDTPSFNVGEAYVKPEYRGQQIAQALLHSLDAGLKEQHVNYEWVEHGTANPTARGFWNKYFETVEYEFIRTVEV